jgi:hypothetical protein
LPKKVAKKGQGKERAYSEIFIELQFSVWGKFNNISYINQIVQTCVTESFLDTVVIKMMLSFCLTIKKNKENDHFVFNQFFQVQFISNVCTLANNLQPGWNVWWTKSKNPGQ